MRIDKEAIIKMRLNGKSYLEISKAFSISKSTLSEWFKNIPWSKEVRNDLTKKANYKSNLRLLELNKVRGERLKEYYKQAREEAVLDCELFKDNPIFIAGVMIYWGEGDKASKNSFRISNTDPAMINLFVLFLTSICNVKMEKIRAGLIIYPDMFETETKKFWIKNTCLKSDNFTKTVMIKGKHKTKILQNGICTLNASSSYLKQKMLVWLKLLPKMIS